MGRAKGQNVATATADSFAAAFGTRRGTAHYSVLPSGPLTDETKRRIVEMLGQVRAGVFEDARRALHAPSGRRNEAQDALWQEIPVALWIGAQINRHEEIGEWRRSLRGAAPDSIPFDAAADQVRQLAEPYFLGTKDPDALLEDELHDKLVEAFIGDNAENWEDRNLFGQVIGNLERPGALPKEIVELGLRNSDYADCLSADGWRKAMRESKRLQQDGTYALSDVRMHAMDVLRDEIKRRHQPQLAQRAQDRKAMLDNHPAVLSTDVIKEQMEAQGLTDVAVGAQTGLTQSIVRKFMARSIRPRSSGNSGKIASRSSAEKFCQVVNVDMRVMQLATFTVEMVGAKRQASGRLFKNRYDQTREYVDGLRADGAPGQALDAIMAHAEGTVIPDKFDDSWLEPYRELVAWERQRLGL